jgi:hypothetical protein
LLDVLCTGEPNEKQDPIEYYLHKMEGDSVQIGMLYATYKLAEDR